MQTSRSPTKHASHGLSQLLALLLPMLPGILAAWWLQVYRPWFWAEFLVLALLARGRSWLFALGLALLWGCDFVFAFAQVNLSSSYAEVLELLRYMPYANFGWILAGLVGLMGLVLWGWLCVRVHRLAWSGRGMLLWALALVGIALAWPARNGFDHDEAKLYGIRNAKLAGSWVLDSQYMQRSLSFFEARDTSNDGKFREIAADGSAMRRFSSHHVPAQKVLLIVVESWGLARNAAENQFWQDLWTSPAWRQEGGGLSFQGSTMKGEFRELCGFLPDSLYIDAIPDAAKCWPNALREQGWRTQSFHGASAKMYRREHWYPIVGFEQSYFLPQLLNGSVMCANVPGVCDYSIAPRVVQTLRGDGKQFTYWLTLNSHTPYSESDLSSPQVKDQVCPVLNLQGARCVHAALLYDFMQSLKAALLQDPIPGLQVVLVGDHTPKFFDTQSREDFDDAAVPYMLLRLPGKQEVAATH